MTQQKIAGWKAIGRFLGREPRTVQLWERERGLPVHRIPGGTGQSVFAYPTELASWLRSRDRESIVLPGATTARVPGLIVMPFAYHAPGGSEYAFVGDGIAQELLHRLTVTPPAAMRVLSWTTSRSFRATSRRADEIAAELGVRYIVEGTVQEIGSRWSIDIRLVDAVRDRIEFADRFVAHARDILSLQSTIAEAVGGHLALHVGGRLLEPFWNEAVSPQAFLAYVAASSAAYRPNARDLHLAYTKADEACALDASFMPARILKASLEFQLARNAGDHSRQNEARLRAQDCIRAAPRLATAKALDAVIAVAFDHDWERADLRYAEILRALPANLHAHWNSANILSVRRRFAEAQQLLDTAVAIDRTPHVAQAQAYLHIWRGEFEAAARIQDEVLIGGEFQYPTSIMQAMVVGMMLQDASRMRTLLGSIESPMRHTYRHFLDACVAVSTREPAQIAIAHRRLADAAKEGKALWYHAALLDGFAGDAGRAAAKLKRAIDLRESPAHNAAVAPCFQSVRGDARFQAQIARLNLC